MANNNRKNPVGYNSPKVSQVSIFYFQRNPTPTDFRNPFSNSTYNVGDEWNNYVNGTIWKLMSIVANVADWVLISSGGSSLLQVTVPNGITPVLPDALGNMNFTSDNGTVVITGTTSDTINFDIATISHPSLSPYIVGPINSDYTTIQAAYDAGVAATGDGDVITLYIKAKTTPYVENLVMTANRKTIIVGFNPATAALNTVSINNPGISINGTHTISGIFHFSNLYFAQTNASMFIASGTCFAKFFGTSFFMSNTTFVQLGPSANWQAQIWNCAIQDSFGDPSVLFNDATNDPTMVGNFWDFENSVVLAYGNSTCSYGFSQFNGLNSKITANVSLSSPVVPSFNMEHCIYLGDTAISNCQLVTGKNSYFEGSMDVTITSTFFFTDCSFNSGFTFTSLQPQLYACGNVCDYMRVTSPAGDHQVLSTDNLILMNSSTVPTTVTLPAAPFDGQTVTIKDGTGNASVNNIAINGNGINIDGQAGIIILADYGKYKITYDATSAEWKVT